MKLQQLPNSTLKDKQKETVRELHLFKLSCLHVECGEWAWRNLCWKPEALFGSNHHSGSHHLEFAMYGMGYSDLVIDNCRFVCLLVVVPFLVIVCMHALVWSVVHIFYQTTSIYPCYPAFLRRFIMKLCS